MSVNEDELGDGSKRERIPGRIMKHDQSDLACVHMRPCLPFWVDSINNVLRVVSGVVLRVVLMVCYCRVCSQRDCPLTCPVCEMNADAA